MYFILTLVFLIVWAVLVPGYPFWLRKLPRVQSREVDGNRVSWPQVDVIVNVRNEAKCIAGKIRDLKQLRYPSGEVSFWIVDGASTDGTAELAENLIVGDSRFKVLRLDTPNKPAGLNAALPLCHGDWVLVTEADARLAADTLLRVVAAGMADPEVAVLGTPVNLAHAYTLDKLHWDMADRLRLEESEHGFASIVTGSCYLFRRSLLDGFPADVESDDVYSAFAAASVGKRVKYVDASVLDLRSPRSRLLFLKHKIRKAHAYLHEVFRFLPKVAFMRTPTRWIFLARAAQIIVAPFLLVAALFSSLGWIMSKGLEGPSVIAATLFIIALLAAVKAGHPSLASVILGVMLTGVLLVTLISYPFSRRGRSFQAWRLDEVAHGGDYPSPEAKGSVNDSNAG